MLTDQVVDIIRPLSFMMEEENLCDEKIVKSIQTIRYDKFEKIIEVMFNQKSISSINPFYSMYKINLETEEFSHHLDIYSERNHTTIQTDNEFMILQILSPSSLVEYILEHSNDNRRYLHIQLSLFVASEIHSNSGHQTILTIDLIENKAYLIDPNGRSKFFEHKYKDDETKSHIKYSQLIDKLLENYFGELLNFGFFMEFVPIHVWNKDKICINYAVKDSVIGSGFCVPTSLLLTQYMSLTSQTPDQVINKFKDIDSETLLNIINNYTYGLYTLLENTKTKK